MRYFLYDMIFIIYLYKKEKGNIVCESDLQEIELMEMKEEETVKIFTVDDKNQLRFLTYQNYYHEKTGREQRHIIYIL